MVSRTITEEELRRVKETISRLEKELKTKQDVVEFLVDVLHDAGYCDDDGNIIEQ